MNCAFCQAVIDDDSFYCDQCGKAILVCSECGTPGKGKRCTKDGKKMILLKDKVSGVSQTVQTPQAIPSLDTHKAPDPQSTTVSPEPQPFSTTRQQTVIVSSATNLCLINQSLGVNLKITSTALIGRCNGEFVSFFGKCPAVSGTHAKIEKQGQSWSVTDLGSTNGTYLNGQLLQPNQTVTLADGVTLRFADIDLQVQIM